MGFGDFIFIEIKKAFNLLILHSTHYSRTRQSCLNPARIFWNPACPRANSLFMGLTAWMSAKRFHFYETRFLNALCLSVAYT